MVSSARAQGETVPPEEFDLLRRTPSTVQVYSGPKRYTQVRARIFKGAVIRVAKTNLRRGCRSGWLQRSGGGYVCSRELKATEETEPRPAARDAEGILDGMRFFSVGKGGSRLFRLERHIVKRNRLIGLFKGSLLVGTDRFRRYGVDLIRTRQGMFARAESAAELPSPITRLGVVVEEGDAAPGGIVIESDVVVREDKDESSGSRGELVRWTPLAQELDVDGDWVALGEGGYVLDDQIARLRPAPIPRKLKEQEKWIAIDLAEQLLTARVGERVVRVVPCSTGKRGNTGRGKFRVQWKRRLQTMNLKKGHVRVEDVQYVMYYNRRRSIAIHTAWWHHDFGKPMSHGCVNLPRDDAKWLYDWATPFSLPEESETFATRAAPGTRVIVF